MLQPTTDDLLDREPVDRVVAGPGQDRHAARVPNVIVLLAVRAR